MSYCTRCGMEMFARYDAVCDSCRSKEARGEELGRKLGEATLEPFVGRIKALESELAAAKGQAERMRAEVKSVTSDLVKMIRMADALKAKASLSDMYDAGRAMGFEVSAEMLTRRVLKQTFNYGEARCAPETPQEVEALMDQMKSDGVPMGTSLESAKAIVSAALSVSPSKEANKEAGEFKKETSSKPERLLKAMLAALDNSDSDAYWEAFEELMKIHHELIMSTPTDSPHLKEPKL